MTSCLSFLAAAIDQREVKRSDGYTYPTFELTTMRSRQFVSTLFLSLASCLVAFGETHPLTQVYTNDDFQFTGVSVSKTGRLFVNFPFWSDKYLNAVVEVMPDGSVKPFPNEDWNRWDLKPDSAGKHFVCVQSVVVDDTDAMWVVDPAAPMLASVVPNGAKLVKIDLKTNLVTRVIAFGSDVVKPDSYLNDIRIDTKRNFAYLTDSGPGGIVVVDLSSGKARRALDGDKSVKLEQGVQIVINGKPVLKNGKPPQFNSDGIALTPDGQYLYYKAVTSKTLYRVKTEGLRSSGTPVSAEIVGQTFPTDGLWIDGKGRLYLSDLSNNAVVRRSPNGSMETVAKDSRLQWPDTFSEGPDGAIYITASLIHESPSYNKGKSVRKQPYTVFKFMP